MNSIIILIIFQRVLIGSCASIALINRLNDIIILDPTSGMVFQKMATMEEETHSQFKLNFTLLKNTGLKEISCGKKKTEYSIVQTAWERMQTSIK